MVQTSAITGQGIACLRTEILRVLGGDSGAQQESGFLTNVRQQKLVEDSVAALDKAAAAVPLKTPHEMVLLDLYSALRALDDITGATTADDILNLIFSSFCIGSKSNSNHVPRDENAHQDLAGDPGCVRGPFPTRTADDDSGTASRTAITGRPNGGGSGLHLQ